MMRVAFIGLGAMGGPMAARISGGEDLDVVAYDLSPAALRSASAYATPAATIAEAVSGSDVVCTMVPADQHLLAIVDQLTEVGSPGQVFVDFSTVSPRAIELAGERLAGRHIAVVGAACMKSVAAAKAGQLSLYVGGPDDGVEALRNVFDRVATDWKVVDSPGMAKMLKIANNLLTATTGYCLLEGIALGHALGCPPQEAVGELRANGVGSWVLENHVAKHALTGDLGAGIFSVAYMGKDLELATAVAGHVARPAVYASLVASAYRGLFAMGLADHYHPIVVRLIERMASRPPISDPVPDVEAVDLGPLWTAMRAVQSVVIDEALTITGASGVLEPDAVRLLQSGSAASDVLGLRAHAAPDWTAVATDLSGVFPLLTRAKFPGIGFALGSQLASARVRAR